MATKSESSYMVQQHTSIIRQQYLSSVALNNIGVRLLERQCYDQASETLRDATNLVKGILMQTSSGTESEMGCGLHLTNLAMQRLGQPQPSDHQAMLLDVLTWLQDGVLTKCETVYQDTVDVLQTILETTPSSYTAFPIRLEENILLEEHKFCGKDANEYVLVDWSFYAQAAIMFHNFSIALLCKSRQNKGKKAQHLQMRALRYSRFSFEIMEKHYALSPEQEEESTEHLPSNYQGGGFLESILLIVILNTLIQTHHEIEQHIEARECYDRLTRRRLMAFRILENCGSDSIRNIVSCRMSIAAAAA